MYPHIIPIVLPKIEIIIPSDKIMENNFHLENPSVLKTAKSYFRSFILFNKVNKIPKKDKIIISEYRIYTFYLQS